MMSNNAEDLTLASALRGDRRSVASTDFREAMSRFGTAVHIATTNGPGGRGGATVSAVTSVSDTPPTVLLCINHQSRINPLIKSNGVFAINTLPASTEALAGAFAGKGDLSVEARFALADWTGLMTGAPILSAARMAVDCRVTGVTEVGTHSVVFGEVVDLSLGDRDTALLYLDRTYYHI